MDLVNIAQKAKTKFDGIGPNSLETFTGFANGSAVESEPIRF